MVKGSICYVSWWGPIRAIISTAVKKYKIRSTIYSSALNFQIKVGRRASEIKDFIPKQRRRRRDCHSLNQKFLEKQIRRFKGSAKESCTRNYINAESNIAVDRSWQ